MFKRFKIRHNEIGLLIRDGAFQRLLETGTHWVFAGLGNVHCERISIRLPYFEHEQLDEIVKSGQLNERAQVIDLQDHERALVWVDGRFDRILRPGLHVIWTLRNDIRLETVDARQIQFEHAQLNVMTRAEQSNVALDVRDIERDEVGILFVDGRFKEVLQSGRHAFWNGLAQIRLAVVDLREQVLNVSGQDLMTSDKVTLRLNALATYRVTDPRKFVSASDDATRALYREAQLVLRKIIGASSLDAFLDDKENISESAMVALKERAEQLGVAIVSLGIRDVILPGDMKDLMNKVTEARKAAEANLIFRREETAAMRSQANTAKLLESNPVLMRLRELEVLEKVASSSNLQVVLGESGLGDRLTKLI